MDQEPVTYGVGRVAELAGVTVRTLHHYDGIGLLVPGARSAAGYRLYAEADVDRLHRILLYRGLGFSLEEVAEVLDDPGVDPAEHLRRQHALLVERIGRLEDVRLAVETMMEAGAMGTQLTREEQFEVFGPDWLGEEYEAEAEQRWGETDAWTQSRSRTSGYTKARWVQIRAEGDAAERAMADAMTAGEAADGPVAMDVAERLRLHVDRWFYECSPAFHRGLGEMYVADPRFATHYEQIAPGLARFTRDAIVANADRADTADVPAG